MAKLLPLIQLLPSLVFCWFYGLLGVALLVITLLRRGPKRFFSWRRRQQRPVVMDDPTLGTHQYVQLESVRLHCVAHGMEGRPLMLFLHGFPECWFSFRYQIRYFSTRYRTVAVDMRGYGESQKMKSISDYTGDKLVEDIRQLIPALGYNKCVLVGHDWGGILATIFTANYPEMVEKLVLIQAPHKLGFARVIRSSIRQLLMSWYVFFFQWPFLAELLMCNTDYDAVGQMFMKGLLNREETEAYKFSLSQPGGLSGPVNWYRAFRYTTDKPLKQIVDKVPAHLIWGERSGAIDKRVPEYSKDYISDLSITWVPSAGHWVLMEEPRLVNRAIDNFLSGKKID